MPNMDALQGLSPETMQEPVELPLANIALVTDLRDLDEALIFGLSLMISGTLGTLAVSAGRKQIEGGHSFALVLLVSDSGGIAMSPKVAREIAGVLPDGIKEIADAILTCAALCEEGKV